MNTSLVPFFEQRGRLQNERFSITLNQFWPCGPRRTMCRGRVGTSGRVVASTFERVCIAGIHGVSIYSALSFVKVPSNRVRTGAAVILAGGDVTCLIV